MEIKVDKDLKNMQKRNIVQKILMVFFTLLIFVPSWELLQFLSAQFGMIGNAAYSVIIWLIVAAVFIASLVAGVKISKHLVK